MSYTPDEKVALVTAWFNQIDDIICALQKLPAAKINHHKKISMLTLCTTLERMAWFRYRRNSSLTTSDRFKKILTIYYDNKTELEKIDLAFLYQWDISEHQDTPIYTKKIKVVHGKIKQALVDLYGSISINMPNRLIDINVLHKILSKKICPACLDKSTLKLFSVYEVIYRFGRCKAIHEGEFITLGYIDLPLLMAITKNVALNLKNECIKEKKLADEL